MWEIDHRVNLELFIACRLLKNKGGANTSAPIVKIAVSSVAVGIAFILLSIFITSGFKKEVGKKLAGFEADIKVSGDSGNEAIVCSPALISALKEVDAVSEVYRYIMKPAVFRKGDAVCGIVFKGVDSLFNPRFFLSHLKSGRVPDFKGKRAVYEILVSSRLANKLKISEGDYVRADFIQTPLRSRKFEVAGIYDSGFKDFDEVTVLCDIRHIAGINGWGDSYAGGLGILLRESYEIDDSTDKVYDILSEDPLIGGFQIRTWRQTAPMILDWLELLDMNVVIIIILIIIVSGFNMVSGLLILILDKTVMIGIMKALGYGSLKLRKLFLYIALGLVCRGMLWGNTAAFVLGGIQYFWKPFSLDPETYYMDRVPISVDIGSVFLLNAGVLAVAVLMLVVPTMLIAKIEPVKSIRFD